MPGDYKPKQAYYAGAISSGFLVKQMESDSVNKVDRLWKHNESLWKDKLEPKILIPLENAGGVDTSGIWHHILSAAFGRTLETFQAVQRLCAPTQQRQFWADAFVLTRQHFEALVTLEWIAQDPAVRSQTFLDELALKEARILETLGDKAIEVSEHKRDRILKECANVEKRHGVGPGRSSLLPRVKAMVDQLAAPLSNKYPHLKWEYDMYYRDVSGFAHPSAWGLMQTITGSEAETLKIESTLQVGEKALLWNGGWFLRLVRVFNDEFKIIPEAEVIQWQEEWAKANA